MNRHFAIALTLTAAVGCQRCGASPESRAAAQDAAAASATVATVATVATGAAPAPAAAAPPVRSRKRGSDVTFLVISDTHFGYGGTEAAHDVLLPKLNAIAGKAYPAPLTGVVAAPRGLLVTGDLTEWGKVEEWAPFVATYGLTGSEGKLRMPVFEMIGNHDKVHGPWVEQQVSARHGGGRFYAWDWDDLHLVALGEAPDDEGLAFLQCDLERLARDVPVVLFFHLALAGPWSTGNWFDETFKSRLARIIENHAVAAIFHGHHHATDHYTWRGIDVFKPGAVKNDAHTFAVVRVTDQRMTVATYDWDRDVFRTAPFDKRLR